MSNSQTYYGFKLDFQKVDQHTENICLDIYDDIHKQWDSHPVV